MIHNLGSLNIDRVFHVAHIARPGETIAGTSPAVFAGGKGKKGVREKKGSELFTARAANSSDPFSDPTNLWLPIPIRPYLRYLGFKPFELSEESRKISWFVHRDFKRDGRIRPRVTIAHVLQKYK